MRKNLRVHPWLRRLRRSRWFFRFFLIYIYKEKTKKTVFYVANVAELGDPLARGRNSAATGAAICLVGSPCTLRPDVETLEAVLVRA